MRENCAARDESDYTKPQATQPSWSEASCRHNSMYWQPDVANPGLPPPGAHTHLHVQQLPYDQLQVYRAHQS
jgi:hypothetical protein